MKIISICDSITCPDIYVGMTIEKNSNYIKEIKQVLTQARQKAYSAVNTAMVEAYWLVGKHIVEEEQNGEDRAAYGAQVIKSLSVALKKEFGKGFSITNLKSFRKFYLVFNDFEKGQMPSALFQFRKGQGQALPLRGYPAYLKNYSPQTNHPN